MKLREQFVFTTRTRTNVTYLATYNPEREHYIVSWEKCRPFHNNSGSVTFSVKTVKAALKGKDWIIQDFNTNEEALILLEAD